MSKNVYHLNSKLGAHTAFSGKICDTLWTSVNYGMHATQFFMGNPQSVNRSKIKSEDLQECRKILDRFPMHVFTHFPYTANLAGAVKKLAWNGDKEQDIKTEKVISSLEYELNTLSKLDNALSTGVVIHPGSFPDRKAGLQAISKSINKIDFEPGSCLILENAAGEGNSLATTFEEIKDIIDGVDEPKRAHIGVCIDTCHTFAYGLYDLRKVSEVDRMFEDFDRIIGLERLKLFHLNDSCFPWKARQDEHATLGTGYIWEDDFDSLKHLLKSCRISYIPLILETHGLDMIVVSLLEG